MYPIAILLAVYNGQLYLRDFLESLRAQTCRDYICYIHDDGSTDGTLSVIEEYLAADPRHFQRLSGPSCGGAKENFMWMLGQVEAQYYMFADQDDVWLPDKIQRSLEALRGTDGKEQPLCVFTDMYVTDAALRVLDTSFIRYIGRDPHRTKLSQVLIDNPAAGCTMMFTRRLRDLAIQLRRPDRIEMHDVWVLAVAAACGEGSIAVIDEPLVYYRQHGNNEMGASSESVCGKIKRNAAELLSGKMLEEKRGFIRAARDLAGQVCLVEGIPEETKDMLEEFSGIGEKGKLARIRFYRRHDLTRKAGTFWMYLWV